MSALLHWQYALAKSELRVSNVLNRGKSEAMTKLNRARAAYKRSLTGRKPVPVYDDFYDYRINGIPCGIVVTYYSGPEFNNWGHPDNREPDQPADVEFFVVDRDGYSAEWLERKADYEDMRLDVLEMCRDSKNQKYDI